jgi:hypothetical protein
MEPIHAFGKDWNIYIYGSNPVLSPEQMEMDLNKLYIWRGQVKR